MQHGCVSTPDTCRSLHTTCIHCVLLSYNNLTLSVQTVCYADSNTGICLLYSSAACLLCNMLVMTVAYTIL